MSSVLTEHLPARHREQYPHGKGCPCVNLLVEMMCVMVPVFDLAVRGPRSTPWLPNFSVIPFASGEAYQRVTAITERCASISPPLKHL